MEDVCRAVTGAYPGEYITDFERCYYIYCTCIRVMITTFDNLIIFIFIFFFFIYYYICSGFSQLDHYYYCILCCSRPYSDWSCGE